MKRSLRLLTVSLGLLTGSAAFAKDLPYYNAYYDAQTSSPASAASFKDFAAKAGGFATSFDDWRGVPTFIFATGTHVPPPTAAAVPDVAARYHLSKFLKAYKADRAALNSAEVLHVHDLGKGAVIVTMQQRVDGVDVFRSTVKVMMRQNLELVAITGNLHPAATPGLMPKMNKLVKMSPSQALVSAFKDLYGIDVPASAVIDTKQRHGDYQYYDFMQNSKLQAEKLALTQPARIKKVLFPMPNKLIPAYFVDFYAGKTDTTSADAYEYVIAADDGRVLFRRNLTESDTFDYRVWAETSGNNRPFEGPQADFSPHPTGVPDSSQPAFVAPNLITMEGFNTNPSGVADPWLAASAVQTLGNNIDAYSDDNAPDGYSNGDLRATVTGTKVFDRVYDTAAEPTSSPNQIMAAVTQLFYTTNWMHDYYYDSGFDEASGNAQFDNFGRGGLGGDRINAQAQDAAGLGNRNNANMSTPADGSPPRMQMYLWTNDTRSLTILPGPLTPNTGLSAFGPPTFNYTGDVVIADDGVGPDVNDGCETISGAVAGKIALINRGTCAFNLKAVNAEAAGATGVIIATVVAGQTAPGMSGSTPVGIPVMSVGTVDGNAIKALLQAGPVTATMVRNIGTERDGDLDNTVVAHEWGHYIHNRLADPGSQQSRSQGEGWGDWMAIHTIIYDEGDNVAGAFPAAVYDTVGYGANAGFFGIRRRPYSNSLAVNPLTFKHIQDSEPLPAGFLYGSGGSINSEVHNAGEIWTAMLFDAYVELLKFSTGPNPTYTYDQVKRLMADYVVAGLKLAPIDHTYTEMRDAILMAALADSPTNAMALATGFLQRGAGSCAVSPPRNSTDLNGVIEGFELKPNMQIKGVLMDDGIKSCDSDGFLDAEEIGKVTIEITNGSIIPLTGTTANVTTSTVGVTFPNGQMLNVPDIAPFGVATITVDVALDESFVGVDAMDLNVALDNIASCNATEVKVSTPRINFDNLPNSSATDDVESDIEVWAKTGDSADIIWGRTGEGIANHEWLGVDFGGQSDTSLESPELLVSPVDPLIVTFDHIHQFEFDANPDTYWDGGIIEITSDGGANWADVSTFGVNPGYNAPVLGNVGNTSGNPLGGQPGYGSTNPSNPNPDTVTLDFGTQFAGKAVKLRFRIGTDAAAGAPGWQIDNIGVQGIVNMPFPTVVDDQGQCQLIPIADAGADQVVDEGDGVTLDASNSSDPNNDVLTFNWTQTAGPPATLSDPGTAVATFTAPEVDADTTLTFEVAVSDGVATVTDTVDVLVRDVPVTSSSSSSGSGGSNPTGSGGSNTSGGFTPVPPADDSGCGCTVVGSTSDAPADQSTPRNIVLGALLGLGMLFRRRQNKK